MNSGKRSNNCLCHHIFTQPTCVITAYRASFRSLEKRLNNSPHDLLQVTTLLSFIACTDTTTTGNFTLTIVKLFENQMFPYKISVLPRHMCQFWLILTLRNLSQNNAVRLPEYHQNTASCQTFMKPCDEFTRFFGVTYLPLIQQWKHWTLHPS